jgi:hypothetical protein
MSILESFKEKLEQKIIVCDVGASPIEGDPVYKELYDKDLAKTILFEPNPEMFDRLWNMIKPDDLVFPLALGNGEEHELKIPFAPGMTSIYEPDPLFIQRMQAYPIWSEVKERLIVKTEQIDEVGITECDFIKLDV